MSVDGGVPLVLHGFGGRCDVIVCVELKVSPGVFRMRVDGWLRVNGETMFRAGIDGELWVGTGIEVVVRFGIRVSGVQEF